MRPPARRTSNARLQVILDFFIFALGKNGWLAQKRHGDFAVFKSGVCHAQRLLIRHERDSFPIGALPRTIVIHTNHDQVKRFVLIQIDKQAEARFFQLGNLFMSRAIRALDLVQIIRTGDFARRIRRTARTRRKRNRKKQRSTAQPAQSLPFPYASTCGSCRLRSPAMP